MKTFNIIKKALVVILLGIMHHEAYSGEGMNVTQAQMERNGSLMTTRIVVDLSDLEVKSNQATVIVPMIVNEADTLVLNGLGVYGRTRWYQFRRAGKNPLTGEGELALKYSHDMEPVELIQNVEYSDWMNGAQLMMKQTDYGCAGCESLKETLSDLAVYWEQPQYAPKYIFEQAIAETIKVRELTGRAYVDFPVNKIIIYPDYRNNTYELGKIIATIDSVKNDPDITVTSIHIAGTASPEGPYDNNVYLAKNRTIALKEYVTNLYNFPKDFIQTSYEPVDWKGLREWLEANNLDNKDKILAIVNSDIEPYARNGKIKTDFPVQYEWLLRNVYPALRHSDYRIEYTIRQFNNIDEIAEVIKTKPQKLSLNEMYALAATLEPGSDEYNDVFETAVRMYPQDETANLNAANSAMQRKDYVSARRFLERAGNGAKSVYARGILAMLEGDYETGEALIEEAQRMGLEVSE